MNFNLMQAFHNKELVGWNSTDSIIHSCQLIYPVFVSDQTEDCTVIESGTLPIFKRFSLSGLLSHLKELRNIKSILLFGLVKDCDKDITGSMADNPDSIIIKAIKEIKSQTKLNLISDVCLCHYTDSGSCGIVDETGNIKLKETQDRLSTIAYQYALAGVDVVAPSCMMDGIVKKIKEKMNQFSMPKVAIMAYSAKFCSKFYYPFRKLVGSNPIYNNRCTHQLPHGSKGLALRAMRRDVADGADVLMVKPSTIYCDIISAGKFQ
ncbi:Porphobilinogen synthase, partial [Intoshia linei]